MQVQSQQVYRQEKSGLDQPSPNNHKTQTVLCFSLQPVGMVFHSVALIVAPFKKKTNPTYFAPFYWFLNQMTFHDYSNTLPMNATVAF